MFLLIYTETANLFSILYIYFKLRQKVQISDWYCWFSEPGDIVTPISSTSITYFDFEAKLFKKAYKFNKGLNALFLLGLGFNEKKCHNLE